LETYGILEVLVLLLKTENYLKAISFPSLHTLELTAGYPSLPAFLGAIMRGGAPVLTHLSIFLNGNQEMFIADSDLDPFLYKVGPNLRFMSLRFQPNPPDILFSCPSLEHLVISISELIDVGGVGRSPVTSHPLLGRIALDLRWYDGLVDWMGLFADYLQFFSEVDRPSSKLVCLVGSESTFTEWMSSSQEDDLDDWRRLMDQYSAILEFEGDSGNHVETPYHFGTNAGSGALSNEDEADEGNDGKEEEGDG
jgi:hypothetical protein